MRGRPIICGERGEVIVLSPLPVVKAAPLRAACGLINLNDAMLYIDVEERITGGAR